MNALLNGKEVRIDETLVFTAPFQKVTTVKYTIVTAKKPAVLRVKFDYAVNSVTIRPLRYRIGYQIVDENTVDIELNGNYNFSVEPNENADNAFLVFAGKSDLLSRNNYKNILYFGYGTHFADKICIDRDSTLVYIEEGAVVHGIIRAENRKHIAVDGYGTLTMQNYSRETDRSTSIYFKFCQDVEIRNIVIKDSCNWHVNLTGCENAHIDNVKLISYRGNSDGFDICGSKNVLVENCFTRVWDDSLVVKGVDVGDIENVVFENCVLWNDFARPMELGVSIRADKMHDVVFRDIDVIHSVTGYPIMGIHHGDRAEVYDIRFENINIESTPGAQLFDLRITDSAWNRDTKKGKIHDFYFKNINLIGDPGIEILPYHSRLQGFSEEHSIRSITFDNITLLGKGVRTIQELGVDIYDYVSDVNIINGQRPYINRVLTEIIPNNFVLNEDGLYTGEVNILFKNISEIKKCGKIKLHVSPCWIGESDFDIEYSTAPGEICTVGKKLTLPAGKFAFSLRSDDVDVLGSMGYVNLDLVLTESYEDSAEYSFGDSYGHMKKGVRFALKDDLLLIKSDLLKKYSFVLYAAEPVPVCKNQMIFSIEDTNDGTAPAILAGENGKIIEGPQIGCPEEITYVFKNQPPVKGIKKTNIQKNLTGETYVTFRQLGLEKDTDNFWLELEILDDSEKRYPFTMFASPVPEESAHMFVNIIRK